MASVWIIPRTCYHHNVDTWALQVCTSPMQFRCTLHICIPGGGGGVLGIYIGGVCPGTQKKGVLGAGTAPKGGLRYGHSPKNGGLRCGHNQKTWVLGTSTTRKNGEFTTGFVKREGLMN